MRWALVVLAVLASLSAGCDRHEPVAARSAPSRPHAAQGSPVGIYSANTRIILANGASAVVPKGWQASVLSTGATVTTETAQSATLGAMLTVPARPHWGSALLRVFADSAAFARELSARESSYGARPTSSTVVGFAFERIELPVGRDTSATAFVTIQHGPSPRREVDLFTRQPDELPLELTVELEAPPGKLDSGSAIPLTTNVLDYLGFAPR